MRKTKSPYLSIVGWGMFLAGALTLGSCTNEDIPGKDEQGPAIEFGEVKTRAEVSEANQVKEFSVFAEQNYLNEDGSESTDFISLLDNERVYRTGENFTYDNTRYWVNDRTFNFFAAYPYMDSEKVKRAIFDGFDGYTIDFTTPATADTDLMISHKTALTTASQVSYPTVDFNFQHILSKVCFAFKKDYDMNGSDTFIITGINLSGVKKDGDYSTSRWNTYTDKWITDDATRSFSKTGLSAEVNMTDNEEGKAGVNPMGEGNGLLLLPQDFDGNITLTVTYQYQIAGTTSKQTKRLQKVLPAGEWKPGKQYMYNITLSENNLIFISTPTVESWGEMQLGGTIIIID